MKSETKTAYRGAIAHCLSEQELAIYPDGLLTVDETGKIEYCGPWLEPEEPQTKEHQATDYTQLSPTQLIFPGLIDLHVHLPQMAVRGCQSSTLLAWLTDHIWT